MTIQELTNINEDLYKKLDRVDYMRLCRMMEHKIERNTNLDMYEFHLYDKIKRELKNET